jgi:hypothetical protein
MDYLRRKREGFLYQNYTYLALDENAHEIRLMTLLPGELHDGIRIKLKVCAFRPAKRLNFEALSYTWGSKNDPAQVFVGFKRRSLSVTRNLADALIHLRSRNKPRKLWIDAICVNQADLKERGSQVKRMAEIYASATRVVVWLGCGNPKSERAIRIISSIASRIDVDWRAETVRSSSGASSPDLDEQDLEGCADLNTPFDFDECQTNSLADLLGRDWFERLWIWQEIWLGSAASILQCGIDTALWNSFRKAIFSLQFKGLLSSGSNESYFLTNRITPIFQVCSQGRSQSHLNIIGSTQDAKCADDRDRVYAILSLFELVGIKINVEPDYTKPFFEVYKEMALQLLLRSGGSQLDVLTTVESQHQEYRSMEEWSSWVPDWSRPHVSNSLSISNAACMSRADIYHDAGAIHVAGVVIAELGNLYRVDPLDRVSPTFEAIKISLLGVIKHFSKGRDLAQAELRSLCRALGTDFAEDYVPPLETVIRYDHSVQALQRFADSRLETLPQSTFTRSEERFLEGAHNSWRGRSVFRTRAGFFGLAPCAAREEDVLVVLLGCRSPLVLRPAGSKYRILGVAYCGGFMCGEALLGGFPTEWEAVYRLSKEGSHPAYRNTVTGEVQIDDPRLDLVELPPGWKKQEHAQMLMYNCYENKDIGEAMHADPRLTTSALRERGVDMKTFEII